MGWPLRKTITRIRPGEPIEDPLTGAIRPGPPEITTHNVLGWDIQRSTEETSAAGGALSVFLVEVLRIYGPPGILNHEDTISLAGDDARWTLSGNAEDATSGPWWDSGLVVYHAQKLDT